MDVWVGNCHRQSRGMHYSIAGRVLLSRRLVKRPDTCTLDIEQWAMGPDIHIVIDLDLSGNGRCRRYTHTQPRHSTSLACGHLVCRLCLVWCIPYADHCKIASPSAPLVVGRGRVREAACTHEKNACGMSHVIHGWIHSVP